MKRSEFIAGTIAVLIFIVVIGITWRGYLKTTNRLYFSVTGFDLPFGDSLSIGKASDVCWKGVPADYMSIKYDEATDSFSYQINNVDSCLYFKLNNKNPNAFTITEGNNISAFGYSVSGKEILELLSNYDNEYYMLSELWARMIPDWKNSPADSAVQKGDFLFNSFVYRKSETDTCKLVILDKHTKLDDQGYRYSYKIGGNELKIQFFKMRSWDVSYFEKSGFDKFKDCFKKPYLSSRPFFNDSVHCYFAKAEQMFTEWGAGHIKISRKDEHFRVTFPKAITTIIPVDSIHKQKENGIGAYLKQLLGSYPLSTDFYIPAFSNSLPEEICELSVDGGNSLCFQRESNRDTLSLSETGGFVPAIDMRTQQLVNGDIAYKAKVLNRCFYLSKHYLLGVVWLILSLLVFLAFPKKGTNRFVDAGSARWYVLYLFLLFFFYMNQKLLIGEKLAFTYPYFEKIFPVTFLTTLFSLFALFLLILIVNDSFYKTAPVGDDGFSERDYIVFPRFRWKGRPVKWGRIVDFSSWRCRILTILAIVVVCAFAVRSMWPSFLFPILDSYLTADLADGYFLFSDAANDNHFTVCTTVGVLLMVLSLFFLLQGKISFAWYDVVRENRLLTIGGFVLCVIVSWVLPGNFGTAFAVATLLYFLSRFMIYLAERMPDVNNRWISPPNQYMIHDAKGLSWILYNLLGHSIWIWMAGTIVVCCIFVGIGLSDFGFFINVSGIGVTWLVIVPLIARNIPGMGPKQRTILHWNLGLGFSFCVVLLICIAWAFCSGKLNPGQVDYSRSTRRVQNFIEPDKVKDAGFSYTESDMQWMEAMRYYAEKVWEDYSEEYDIYGEDNGFHPLLSTGQSPVILNDVCVPCVYLGSLRRWGCLGLLLGLVAIGGIVWHFCVLRYVFDKGDNSGESDKGTLTIRQVGSMLAANIWILESIYLLLSYYWVVPFTGRLIPGFGVDAVGESLEILVLFGFMCSVSNPLLIKNNKNG